MRAPVALAVALGLVAGLPTHAIAQDTEPLRLDLAQALSLAEGGNPALRRATNSAGINGAAMRSTWMDQLLPRASLTLFTTNFTGNLQRQAFDDFGNPRVNPSAEWNYFSQTRHSLNVSWSFQGPSLFQAHRRQKLENQDRDLTRTRALTDMQIEVQRLYLDALEQRELMRAEEELIEARRTDLDVAERLFALALRTRVDVLNAELQIEQQTLALRQQEATYERALLALRTAMGISDERELDIVDEELPIFDPVGFQADALISRALEVNPAVSQSEVSIRTAEVALSEQKSSWWPQVEAGIQVFKRAYLPEGEALFDPSLTGDYESNFYVQFSIPVLNGLVRQSTDQQQASIELRNQRETDREERLQLEEAIRGAVFDLDNQWESFRLAERSNEIAQEALLLAREEYRLGTRSFEDLQSSFETEADTRRQVITARHSFVDALLVLEEAVGTSMREMIPASATGTGN